MIRLGVLLVVVALLAPTTAGAQYPLFDAHIHYSRPDWDTYTPERILSILAKAGIRRALVSSTPDDGTLKLYDKAPAAIVPLAASVSHARRHEHVAARRGGGRLRGRAPQARHLPRDRRGALRRERRPGAERQARWPTWPPSRSCSSGATSTTPPSRAMLKTYPGTKMLWAHAGMSAPARSGSVSSWIAIRCCGSSWRCGPTWRRAAPSIPSGAQLFMRHPDRFLIGTDTWVTSRWESVISASEAVQVWLRQLPREVAEQIAWKNGDRLFPPP